MIPPAHAEGGPLLAAAAVVAGVGAGQWLGPSPAGGCLAAGAVVLVAGVRAGPAAGRVLARVGLALLAAASMQRALDGLDGPLARLSQRGPEVVLSARLAEDPRPRAFLAVRVLARVTAIHAAPGAPVGGQGTLVVVARGGTASRLRLLSAGESVTLAGRLAPLAGGEARLRWRHAAARLEATDLYAARPAVSAGLRLANGVREIVLRGSRGLPRTEGALVAGLLVGDDRELPADVAADFRVAGLSHLLAVSGANVGLALVLAGPALRRFDLAGRLAGGLAVLAHFAAVTRFEPSVLRASAMTGLSLVAGFLGRPANGLRTLALAVAGLVLVDPFLVHSIGFALSSGATAGIVVLARPVASGLPGPRWVREPFAITLAAQLGAAPVALPAFGGLPLAALPANVAAAPAVAAIGLWGLLSGLVGGLADRLWPGLATLLQAPSGALARYLAGVASLAARFPAVMGPHTVGAVLALGAGAFTLSGGLGPRSRDALGRRSRDALGRRSRGLPAPANGPERPRPVP